MNPNNTNTVLTRPKYPPNRPNHRFSGEERKLLQTAMLNGCDATLKSKDQRTELAIKLNVDEERIRQWFSNNRSKSKELLSIPPSISTPPPITSAVLSPFVPNFGITSVPPAPPSLPKEVRLEPYRPNPTHLMVERIAKAQLQRCRLVAKRIISPLHVEYKVNSSVKGTVHVCSVKEKPHCECVDFESGRNCKHLIFIFMRVLGLGPNSPILYQRALLKSELLNMFAQGAACDPTYVYALRGRKFDVGVSPTQAPLSETVCPACYEPFKPNSNAEEDEVSWCQFSCGGNVHKQCFKFWKKAAYKNMIMLQCLHCGQSMTKDDDQRNKAIQQKLAEEGNVTVNVPTPIPDDSKIMRVRGDSIESEIDRELTPPPQPSPPKKKARSEPTLPAPITPIPSQQTPQVTEHPALVLPSKAPSLPVIPTVIPSHGPPSSLFPISASLPLQQQLSLQHQSISNPPSQPSTPTLPTKKVFYTRHPTGWVQQQQQQQQTILQQQQPRFSFPSSISTIQNLVNSPIQANLPTTMSPFLASASSFTPNATTALSSPLLPSFDISTDPFGIFNSNIGAGMVSSDGTILLANEVQQAAQQRTEQAWLQQSQMLERQSSSSSSLMVSGSGNADTVNPKELQDLLEEWSGDAGNLFIS